jgi:hypothetical protein
VCACFFFFHKRWVCCLTNLRTAAAIATASDVALSGQDGTTEARAKQIARRTTAVANAGEWCWHDFGYKGGEGVVAEEDRWCIPQLGQAFFVHRELCMGVTTNSNFRFTRKNERRRNSMRSLQILSHIHTPAYFQSLQQCSWRWFWTVLRSSGRPNMPLAWQGEHTHQEQRAWGKLYYIYLYIDVCDVFLC